MSEHRIKAFASRQLLRVYALLEPLLHKNAWVRESLKTLVRWLPQLRKALGHSQTEAYRKMHPQRQHRQILIDVTHMSKTELHTGIQRVVRAILAEIGPLFPGDVDVEPVVLSSKGGLWHYCYHRVDDAPGEAEVVVPKDHDVFLGIDLNAQVVSAERGGLFDDWKRRGVTIIFTVHDILPITHPQWWRPGVTEAHERWLRTILAVSDKVVSVSKATSDAVQSWARQQEVDISTIVFEWFHLGADIQSSSPTKGMPASAATVLESLKSLPTFLVVGTLEPRKGHTQCLSAFDYLWREGVQANLVFVGKEGWMVRQLVDHIRQHPQAGHHLFWLDGISDEYLEQVYRASTCLIACSEAEGFGLPLIEAAQHGLPVIARDIPVFREVAGHHAFYFKGESAEVLAENIKQWLVLFEQDKHIDSTGLPWQTWRQSAASLKQIIDV